MTSMNNAINFVYNTNVDSKEVDLDEHMLQFLIENNDSSIVQKLLNKHNCESKNCNVCMVIEHTVSFIAEDPTIANISIFPYNYIYNNSKINALCSSSPRIFYNVLYRAVYKRDNAKIFSLIENFISKCNDLEILSNIFGLSRRIGVPMPIDKEMAVTLYFDTDITQNKNYKYIFFLEYIFDSDVSISHLYPVLQKMLTHKPCKDCFQELVKNVLAQDRHKMMFEKEKNATNKFVKSLFVLTNKLFSGFMLKFEKINFSNVAKIGTNKFPTFLFFSNMLLYNILDEEDKKGADPHYIVFVILVLRENIEMIKEDMNSASSIVNLNNASASVLENNVSSSANLNNALSSVLENNTVSIIPRNNTVSDGRTMDNNTVPSAPENNASTSENVNYAAFDVRVMNNPSSSVNLNNTPSSSNAITRSNHSPTNINFTNDAKFSFDTQNEQFYETFLDSLYQVNIHKTYSVFEFNILESLANVVHKLLKRYKTKAFKILNRYRILTYIQDRNLHRKIVEELISLYSDQSDEMSNIRYNITIILQGIVLPLENSKTLRMISFLIGDLEECFSKARKNLETVKSIRNRILENCNEFEELYYKEDKGKVKTNLLFEFFLKMPHSAIIEKIQTFDNSREFNERLFDQFFCYRRVVNNSKVLDDSKNIFSVFDSITEEENEILKYDDFLENSCVALENYIGSIESFLKNNKRLFLNKNVFYKVCSVLNSMIKSIMQDRHRKSEVIELKEGTKWISAKSIKNNDLTDNILTNSFSWVLPNLFEESDKKVIFKKYSFLLKLLEIVCKFKKHGKFLPIEVEYLSEALSIVKKKDKNNPVIKDVESIIEAIQSNQDEEEYEVPDDLLDPVTCVLMEHPVRLLTSRQTIDKSTFNAIMLGDRRDPFNRMELQENSWEVDLEMEKKIEEYLKGIKK